ncbi:MAG: hypothetical protein M1830_005187 [Pleopsidium flavum]|nr:MAG: hypothetical protein M1830_005187 [Pleopsidium flavum]
MYPHQLYAGHQLLPTSKIQALHLTSVLPTLIMSSSMTRRPCPRSTLVLGSRRTFWWGRKSHRVWTSYLDANFQNYIEARQRILKHKCAKALQRSALWERDHPVNQYRPSWGWRLSSSWGKPGGRWVSVDELPKEKEKEEQKLDPWYTGIQSRPERLRRRMEEVKRRVDEDPFKAIFGSRLEGTYYNPAAFRWSPLNWGLASKADTETGTAEVSPTGEQPRTKPAREMKDELNFATQVDGHTPSLIVKQQTGASSSDKTGSTAFHRTGPAVQNSFSNPGVGAPISPSPAADDFVIDPITLRKIPRKASPPLQPSEVDRDVNARAIGIPVKKFAGYRPQSGSLNASGEAEKRKDLLDLELSKYEAPPRGAERASTIERPPDPLAGELEKYDRRTATDSTGTPHSRARRYWLDLEGFGSRSHPIGTSLPVRDLSKKVESASKSDFDPPRIESSLDRQQRDGPKVKKKVKSDEFRELRYNDNESKAEDIDLLRASDVRASSGLTGKPRKETNEEKQQRRKKLEDDFYKPQGLETQYAEEMAAQAVARKRYKAKRVDAEDGYDTKPQGLETSYLNVISSQEPPMSETDAFGYDLKPQGLEISYERELENSVPKLEKSYVAEVQRQAAAMRDAEIDGFDKKPQGLETSFAREQEPQGLETHYAREVAAHKALLEAAEVDGFSREPQGLETSFARESKQTAAMSSSTQGVEAQKVALEDVEVGKIDKMRQGCDATYVAEMQQTPGEGDMSANVHEFAGRDRWYKKKAPHATEGATTSLREKTSDKQIGGSYEGSSEGFSSKLRHGNFRVTFENKTPDAGVKRGLEAYDDKLGSQAYQFHTGQDSLEADILAQSKDHSAKSVTLAKVARYGSKTSPEALAMRWEEEEQKLHEEIKETNDLLSEVQEELAKISASKKRSSSTDAVGHEAQEATGTFPSSPGFQKHSAAPSVAPDISAVKAKQDATIVKERTRAVYRILAYDASTQDITTATTTSSTTSPSEAPVSLSEAMSRLANPAKFLPYFRTLEASGYEVVSGSGDVLVFRRFRDAEEQISVEPAMTSNPFSDFRRPMNPIDGTTTQTGNFASPTGFVNHDAVFPPALSEQAPSPRASTTQTGGKVRREEGVFSGSSRRWQDGDSGQHKPKGGVRKAARRIFWVGVWTAGCCYAVGVVAEFFRTGGSNGMGAQGF